MWRNFEHVNASWAYRSLMLIHIPRIAGFGAAIFLSRDDSALCSTAEALKQFPLGICHSIFSGYRKWGSGMFLLQLRGLFRYSNFTRRSLQYCSYSQNSDTVPFRYRCCWIDIRLMHDVSDGSSYYNRFIVIRAPIRQAFEQSSNQCILATNGTASEKR